VTSTSDTGVELSVIIAAKNAVGSLAAQLDALLVQEWGGGWEIVVADNGSTDGTRNLVEVYEHRDERVRLVDASRVPGAGFARNAAIQAAKGRSLAFCDADDLVMPGWVAAMGEALRRSDAVGGRNLFDQLNPPWLRHAFYSEPPDRLETFAGIFPFAATCNLGVRRTVIDHVGGFDEQFLTGQDLELCLRIWANGHHLAYEPHAVVQYRYRPDMRALFERSRDYGLVGPVIARRLAELGQPTPPRWSGLKSYIWLARKLPTLRRPDGKARWLVVAGGKIGRLRGSLRERWIYL
jgi:glycosyltransferase involved in cell wall biosynthesis